MLDAPSSATANPPCINAEQQPMGSTEVLLQGFNWECHAQRNPSWCVRHAAEVGNHHIRPPRYKVLLSKAEAIAEAGITAVWLPPPSQSVSSEVCFFHALLDVLVIMRSRATCQGSLTTSTAPMAASRNCVPASTACTALAFNALRTLSSTTAVRRAGMPLEIGISMVGATPGIPAPFAGSFVNVRLLEGCWASSYECHNCTPKIDDGLIDDIITP